MEMYENTTYVEFINSTQNTTSATGPPQTETLTIVLNLLIGILLAVIMVGMGCAVELQKIKKHLKRPTGVITGFVCQFGLMPLIAYILILIFSLSDAQSLALLIQAACPGGSASNVATYWMNGDMDLSITMTTCSSILALGMMPLLLFLYGQTYNESLVVPFDTLGITLATLIIPIAIGIFIRYMWPSKATIVLKVCSIGGIIVIAGVAVVSIVAYGSQFVVTAFQIVTACILPFVGMVLGYGLSSLVSLYRPLYLHHNQRRTVCVETGIQNTQLSGSIILLSGFAPQIIGEMVIVPLLYAMAQVFWAIALTLSYRLYQRRKIGNLTNESVLIETENKKQVSDVDDTKESEECNGVVNITFTVCLSEKL
uniref:ileal sodium/bile acid cotransporter-like n=1 Tax=Ciona intestinalis TaxID=7719 RepID=UPI000EF43EB9|nr:ileal sodium/bile acid cotransporter-like [Ciona intestinalis]|eukprot:XP_026695715.1 ileal sodium/bile acid cotransporter-like [Ciona intestinalis]